MRVRKEMIEGIQDFLSFYKLIEIAIKKENIPIHQRTAALSWYGYYIGNKSIDLFIGIYLDKPQYLYLQTQEGVSIKRQYLSGNDKISIGTLDVDKNRWEVKLKLDNNEIFVDTVFDFVKDNVAYARTIIDNPTF
jgi:hypothetical protein